MTPNELDLAMMTRAIELSERGFPAPNPHVGCVICQQGVVVGEGYHDHAGGVHAEVMALNQADSHASGATAYVTLEPCHHQGRTGPCSMALLKAGVKRVVVAVMDPNPVAKGGLNFLRDSGVDVEVGLLAKEAEEVNFQFLFALRNRRPWVRAKVAITVDGKIAWPDGSSKWITGPASREDGHRLRAESGAVLVGRRTVEFDDPRLTARIDGVVNQPLRVVIDPSGKLEGTESVFGDVGEFLWLGQIYEDGKERNPNQTLMPSLEPVEILEALWLRGVTGLLIEGGAGTIRRFFEAELVDELVIYMAPKLFGAGLQWLGEGRGWMPDGIALGLVSVEQIGDDVKLCYRVNRD